jgi:hypothetical protein
MVSNDVSLTPNFMKICQFVYMLNERSHKQNKRKYANIYKVTKLWHNPHYGHKNEKKSEGDISRRGSTEDRCVRFVPTRCAAT